MLEKLSKTQNHIVYMSFFVPASTKRDARAFTLMVLHKAIQKIFQPLIERQ